MEYNLPVIRKQLVEYFNNSELQELCFQLDVDYEIINGENKLDKARELLTYLNRRNRMPELVAYCQRERPSIQWNIIKTAQAMGDEFAENVGLTPAVAAKYYEAKFELYRSVWQALYRLKEAGEQLWQRVSKENIAHFAGCLHEAQRLVGSNEILFDRTDLEALTAVMTEFNQFRAGKVLVGELRSTQEEELIYAAEIQYQVERNRAVKERYEALLQTISDQFRTQLNAWVIH
ncbi:MAG: hypothetical protein H6667_13170 [Ardenticatenaceae bacterium]|nr:hypothetical protein [Ardenticatenaceae bacterium]MCB9442695.1 hypothetical protein [Ardenticatenaceae bacterium]